jgi:hypothetical protein
VFVTPCGGAAEAWMLGVGGGAAGYCSIVIGDGSECSVCGK